MDIIERLQWRYAVKKFSKEKLPEEQVQTILKGLQLTASSYGLQFMKYVVVSSTQLREQLLEQSFQQHQVIDASHLLVLCRETDVNLEEINRHIKRVSDIRKTPIEGLEGYQKHLENSISNMTTNQYSTWLDHQLYLSLGALLTICAIEKVDACPMEGFSKEGYDDILNLKERGLTSVLVCPIGYRSTEDSYANKQKIRRPLEELVLEL